MRRRSMRLISVCAGAMLAAATSCSHRDLCYDHSHYTDLKVEFDWSQEPDADPRTMVVYMFPQDGGMAQRIELSDVNGSIVRVPSGRYDVAVFNGDTETLVESGERFGEFVITTDEESILSPLSPLGRAAGSKAPRPEGTEDEPIKHAPDVMWSASCVDLTVHSPSDKTQTVRFTPRESTVTYRVVLQNAENVSDELTVSAALTGVAESYSISSDVPVGVDVTVPFPVYVTGEQSMGGSVTIFGHCPEEGKSRRHMLTIYTANHFYYHYDVTDQIHDAGDKDVVTIVIDGIRLPRPDETGMNTEVSEWGDAINENIDML